jgi:hypothetical protein
VLTHERFSRPLDVIASAVVHWRRAAPASPTEDVWYSSISRLYRSTSHAQPG